LADDQSGINITGDVGHKIRVIPDEDPQNQKEVTYLFEYEPDSYLRGTVQLPLTIFPQFAYSENGDNFHQLTFKAWDNANNSSHKSLYFEVVQSGNLVLKDVLNYPNPFQNSTTFTFYLNNEAQIDIKIYTLSGRLITHFRNLPATFGFNLVPWDGRDQEGDELANGVYFYRIQAKAEEHSVESIGKLVKMQ